MMKYEVARIAVEHPEPRSSIINVSYQTPQWAQAISNGGHMTANLLWICGTALVAKAAYHGLFRLPTGKAIVATFIVSLLIYWLVWNIDGLLQDYRHRHGIIKNALQIGITPQYVEASGPGTDFHLPRTGEMLFTIQPHRLGIYEEREEKRTGRRQGYAYRDAFEIWVQAGHQFERIAAVADEKSARAIVRHCQQADELATRAGRQHDAYAHRHQPV